MTFALKRALIFSAAAVAAFQILYLGFAELAMVAMAVLFWSVPLIPGSWYLVVSDHIRQKRYMPKRNSCTVLAVFVAIVTVLGTLLALTADDDNLLGAFWFVYPLWWYCVLLVAILLLRKKDKIQAFYDRYETTESDINTINRKDRFEMTAFRPADILLPKGIDMTKWAVVACDQYTSEPEYWADVEKITSGSKSTLELILPEVYLENDDVEQRIERIHEKMNEYVSQDSFTEYKDSLIYIERTQADGKVRAGIVGAIDLEQYDYNKGSKSQVRATEATVVERIPPRVKVRCGAPIELPHIMILVDDVQKCIVEPLAQKKDSFEKVYDFDMMKNGGHITGWVIDKDTQSELLQALEKFASKEEFNKRYGYEDEKPLTFAMGDGNHSLATAKAFYEQQKKDNPDKDMTKANCRFALVEIVDLHSPALEFEAIHRICTGIDREKLLAEMTKALELSKQPSEQKITVVLDGSHEDFYIHKPSSKLTVGSLQNFLDDYMKNNGGKIDYIHGTEVIDNLSKSADALGVLLPDMAKSELFPTVICDGALPRKTFSMGHAWDKRYYVEARKITD